jgi:hypothetical protein
MLWLAAGWNNGIDGLSRASQKLNGVVTLKASQNVVAHHGSVFLSAIAVVGRFWRDNKSRAGRVSDVLLSDPRDKPCGIVIKSQSEPTAPLHRRGINACFPW